MSDRYELRLSGSGGQGLILAGKILAQAAVIWDNKNAVQSQSYGPEARGGASKSDVIISKDEIDYPKAQNVDVLLALTQESCDKYANSLKEGGILIVDERFVQEIPSAKFRIIKVPIYDIAKKDVGIGVVANIVSLGLIQAITNIVSYDALKNSILERVPKGTEQINIKALDAGVKKGEEYVE
ncbi:2-oxoacid:acceptor oxidoreductase family protein [bacterium]|nr:2-oxoacid:acceptor oxidoreductase family protein [bacterium]